MPESARSDEHRLSLPSRAGDPLAIRPGRIQASADRVRPSADRRDAASRQRLLRRVEMEYVEMPGLCLTLPQAKRLFVLRDDICVRVLGSLEASGVLRRNEQGAFVFTGDRVRRQPGQVRAD